MRFDTDTTDGLTAQQQLKEFQKCKDDPIYFIENYVFIEHPALGVVKFQLYKFQKDLINLIMGNQKTIINKSRQTGISTLSSALALWMILFHSHKNVAIISRTDDEAVVFLDKVKLAYDELPKWMQIPYTKKNDHQLLLQTGSRAFAVAASKNAGRGRSLAMLILDEAAFQMWASDIWKAAAPTLSRGNGKCIAISTPNGAGNWFYDTVTNAQKENEEWNGFKYFFCNWRDVPEYDDEWYRNMRPTFSDEDWAQEYEGDFLGSGRKVIPVESMRRIQSTVTRPFQRLNTNLNVDSQGELWIWKRPKPGHIYVLTADIATGNGEDNTGIIVWDMIDKEQAAEFYGDINVHKSALLIKKLALEYNEAYVIIENNTYGHIVVLDLLDRLQYTNMFFERDILTGKTNFKKPGFKTSARTRSRVVEGVKEAFASWNIYSERLLKEATTFVWHNNRAEADNKTCHDDLIFATGLCIGNLDFIMQDNTDLQAIASKLLPEFLRNEDNDIDDDPEDNGFANNIEDDPLDPDLFTRGNYEDGNQNDSFFNLFGDI